MYASAMTDPCQTPVVIVPNPVIFVCDAVCIVPSKLATKVPVEYPVPLVLTVDVGASSKSLNIFHFPESVASLKIPPYKSWEPVLSYRPYKPMSIVSVVLLL